MLSFGYKRIFKGIQYIFSPFEFVSFCDSSRSRWRLSLSLQVKAIIGSHLVLWGMLDINILFDHPLFLTS